MAECDTGAVKIQEKVTVDPLTVSVVRHSLQNTVREMSWVVMLAAQSFAIAEIHDFGVAILDRAGRTVALTEYLPMHVTAGPLVVQALLKRFSGELYPGDVILQNDPFTAGGNHLPDWSLLVPVFVDGELTFFTFFRGHQMDTGGFVPGGYAPRGYDIHSEGLVLPPTKIFDKGRETGEYRLILSNVRWPEVVRMDNLAMKSALEMGERKLVQLCAKYGKATVEAATEHLMDSAERAMRASIAQIPDGTYRAERGCDRDGHLNPDGTLNDDPVFVRVSVTVKGDSMVVDYSGSDKQVASVNMPLSITYGFTMGTIFMMVDPNIVHNEGAYRPIQVIAPEGTVVNPRYPATVCACACHLGVELVDCLRLALSQAIPKDVTAGWCNHFSPIAFGDDTRKIDPVTGQPVRYWHAHYLTEGGSGAIWGYDGWQHIAPVTTAGGIRKVSVEMSEITAPWRVLRYGLATDSAGAGSFRGGLGLIYEAINEGGEGMVMTGTCGGEKYPPFGLLGGREGRPIESYILRKGKKITLHTVDLVPIFPGDIIGSVTSGGGGVGDPFERDVEKVREDVLNEFVSIVAAKREYGVVIDPDTVEVDLEASKKLRSRRRRANYGGSIM